MAHELTAEAQAEFVVHAVGHAEPPGKPLALHHDAAEERAEGIGWAEVKLDHSLDAVGQAVTDAADVQDVMAEARLLHSPDAAAPHEPFVGRGWFAVQLLPAPLHGPPGPQGPPVVEIHLPLVALHDASGLAVTVAPAFAQSWSIAWYASLLSLSLHEDESMQEFAVVIVLPLQRQE